MANPKEELVRIRTEDGLELQGILFEPAAKSADALVHVHAWAGNFYENKFIDSIAEEAVANGFAFLSFNNRGAGFVTDLIKRGKSGFKYVRIGACLEKFEDCIKDVSAALTFLSSRGYINIALQGHSTGCQKVTYYKFKTKDKRVKCLVELSPADDVIVVKRLLGSRYKEALAIANRMVKEGKARNPVPEWMAFYPLLSARTFLSVASPKSASGRIFDYSGKLAEIKNVGCPMLVAFGSKDIYETNPEEKLRLLNERVWRCSAHLFAGSNHWFSGHEAKLARLIFGWVRKVFIEALAK